MLTRLHKAKLLAWASSPNLNPDVNMWAIVSQKVFAAECTFATFCFRGSNTEGIALAGEKSLSDGKSNRLHAWRLPNISGGLRRAL